MSASTVPAFLPGLNQIPFCVKWKCLSLGNDFSRVDKSQHGDLQLGEQPFGYTEPCLALSNSNLTGVAGFQLAAVHTEQLAGAAGKDRAEWRGREELVVLAVEMEGGRKWRGRAVKSFGRFLCCCTTQVHPGPAGRAFNRHEGWRA